MTKPTSIRILGLDYKITYKGEEWQRSAKSLAQCDTKLGTITLPDDASNDRLACAFVHEIMHAILYVPEWDRDLKEEEVCNAAGYFLTAVWRDNPEVFEWWSGLITGRVNDDT